MMKGFALATTGAIALAKYLKTVFDTLPKCELAFHLEFGDRTCFCSPFPNGHGFDMVR